MHGTQGAKRLPSSLTKWLSVIRFGRMVEQGGIVAIVAKLAVDTERLVWRLLWG